MLPRIRMKGGSNAHQGWAMGVSGHVHSGLLAPLARCMAGCKEQRKCGADADGKRDGGQSAQERKFGEEQPESFPLPVTGAIRSPG